MDDYSSEQGEDRREELYQGEPIYCDCGLIRTLGSIGRGRTCIAYKGSRIKGIERLADDVVVKEFYPFDESASRERNSTDEKKLGRLKFDDPGTEKFKEVYSAFKRSAENSKLHYRELLSTENRALPIELASSDDEYDNLYSITTFESGNTLSNEDSQKSLKRPQQILEVMDSLLRHLETYHDVDDEKARVFLDLKPDNIYLYDITKESPRRVELFDFDTVQSLNDIRKGWCLVPINHGYGPAEQERGWSRTIDCSTDIYSVGAILYFILVGDTPSRENESDLQNDDFSLAQVLKSAYVNNKLFTEYYLDCFKSLLKQSVVYSQPSSRYANASLMRADVLKYLNSKSEESVEEPLLVVTLTKQRRPGYLTDSDMQAIIEIIKPIDLNTSMEAELTIKYERDLIRLVDDICDYYPIWSNTEIANWLSYQLEPYKELFALSNQS